jgi:SAM-dependent methyltransferase
MNYSENFRPVYNFAPKNRFWRVLFILRSVVDFQLLTIYRQIKPYLALVQGSVLDVGCGDCAYQHLLAGKANYIGIDIFSADSFDYKGNPNIIHFDGKTIPLPDTSVDHIICSEVMEHISEPQQIIGEMYRVLKPGGDAFITIPWSARYHYIPHDYARYTPSKLRELFAAFTITAITARGSDITAVCNKLIVMMLRTIFTQNKLVWWKLPLLLIFGPVGACVILWAHGSLWLGLGSVDDPLGYTITLKKS